MAVTLLDTFRIHSLFREFAFNCAFFQNKMKCPRCLALNSVNAIDSPDTEFQIPSKLNLETFPPS